MLAMTRLWKTMAFATVLCSTSHAQINLSGTTWGFLYGDKLTVQRLGKDVDLGTMTLQFVNATDFTLTPVGSPQPFTGTYVLDRNKVVFTFDANGRALFIAAITDWVTELLINEGINATPTITLDDIKIEGKIKSNRRGTSMKFQVKSKMMGTVTGFPPSKVKYQMKAIGSPT
ncbi:MAG: hypothetical protein H6833_07675 [Planctomycetes bacterium]|nr:hypothetical protein [Planctomycetota bacterium]